ncbi:Glycosyltransferase 25 family member [Lamellibrachia satsuma]|nr:Glycosyltransferase 25 family member [Lamellibrachia satsuma]
MINLERRPDRRYKMFRCFEELGIQAKTVSAVDGQKLNDSYLQSLGVKMLPGYEDPYHKRPRQCYYTSLSYRSVTDHAADIAACHTRPHGWYSSLSYQTAWLV